MEQQLKGSIANIFSFFSGLYTNPISWHQDISEDKWRALGEEIFKVWNLSFPIEWSSVQNCKELNKLYTIHFSGGLKSSVLPIESVYKPWTQDRSCALPFAKSKGYLLGDSAYHMFYLLESFQIELPEEYSNTPDHLVILLDFLSVLYKYSTTSFIEDYLIHHFDWLRDYNHEFKKHAKEGSFYLALTDVLVQVIEEEKARVKKEMELAATL